MKKIPKGYIENGSNDINIKSIAYYEDFGIYLENGNRLKSPFKKVEIRELIINAQCQSSLKTTRDSEVF